MKDQSFPSTYAEADTLLQGRNKDSRKLGNHTYLKRLSILGKDSLAVRYHQTDVVTFWPDGRIELNSDGYRTVTTKARINACGLPYFIVQRQGIWYMVKGSGYPSNFHDTPIFQDHVMIMPDGTLTGVKSSQSVKPILKLKKQAQQYVKGYVNQLLAGHIGQPSGADCWYCSLKTTDGKSLGEVTHSDHIKQHIKEKYYVPSLLQQAVKRFPVSIIASDTIHRLLTGSVHTSFMCDITARQVESSLKRYVYEQLQIAS